MTLDGIETHVIGPSNNEYGTFYPRVLKVLGHLPRSTINRAKALSADLIHAHFGYGAVEIEPVVRALSMPLITTFHGSDITTSWSWWTAGHGGWAMRAYPRRLRALASRTHCYFVAVSESVKQQAIAKGIPEERIDVRYIGVDTRRFRPGQQPAPPGAPKRVLFVGRLVPEKGCEFLIRALGHLRLNENVDLIVAGDGILKAGLVELAHKLGVSAKFLGSVKHATILDELQRARVLCLPSIPGPTGREEALGMVLLEAQSCGVPVIGSAIGGIPETIVERSTGFTVPPMNVVALAEKLRLLIDNDELACRMGRDAREFILRRFEIRQCTSRLEETYDRVISETSRSRLGSSVQITGSDTPNNTGRSSCKRAR